MKYIVKPIIKLLWAVILTFFVSIIGIVSAICETLWDAKLSKGIAFEMVELSRFDEDDMLSPYAELPPYKNQRYYYKTYFHYIWGIKGNF